MNIKEYNELKNKTPETYKISESDKEVKEYFDIRLKDLKEYRSPFEKIWKAADNAYIPHTLDEGNGKKVLVSDDETGWRSSLITIGNDNWQEKSVSPNPYIKVNTALGIIIDRNPTGVFSPGSKKYKKTTPLIKNLYTRSWETASSKDAALKPVVFNMAKYGLGIGRTYPLKIVKQQENITEYNEKGNKYDNIESVLYDDIFRENISPWNCWIDNMAKVGNYLTVNDWIFYKDYNFFEFQRVFGHLSNAKYVRPKRIYKGVEQNIDSESTDNVSVEEGVRVWFLESLQPDLWFIITDEDIVLVNEPIPRKPKNKRLSCWFAPWSYRDDSTIYGIGVYEAMRNDYKKYVKIENMTVDQVVQSIYKEFFYEGTDSLEGDGIMKVKPGAGRQVINPQNIRWNEVPGPGKDAWEGLGYFKGKMDDSTGITKTLEGELTGSTAFETAQAREGALRRLKGPLDFLTCALEQEAYQTVGLIEELYSIPKVEALAEPKLMEEFNEETQEWQQIKQTTGEVPREISLSLERDKEGNILDGDKEDFFEIIPDELPWEGIIKIKAQSIIAPSELLDRTTKLEMVNLLIPLLGQDPMIVGKTAKNIVKLYDEDPDEWLPDHFINPVPLQLPGMESLFSPIQGGQEAEKAVPSTEVQSPKVSGAMGGFLQKINPFK